ncbi:hypothetical protein RDV78_07755 [Bacillota bacterium LX-D]|nr:hypothetical protein [Bacillota bacterium LX-D]
MNKKFIMLLCLSLTSFVLSGCFQEIQPTKAEKKPTTAQPKATQKAAPTKPAKNSGTGQPKENDLLIKTENKISEQEADELIQEVDEQLTDLIETLDQMESNQIPEEDLEY